MTSVGFTGKNNGFPFLDILGYLRISTKISNLEEWDKSQLGNLVGNSLIRICLTLPNLGFLWVFFKYPKISKNGNLLFFPVFGAKNSFFRGIQRENWRFLVEERASSLFRIKSWLIPAAVCPLSFAVSSRIWLVAKQYKFQKFPMVFTVLGERLESLYKPKESTFASVNLTTRAGLRRLKWSPFGANRLRSNATFHKITEQ